MIIDQPSMVILVDCYKSTTDSIRYREFYTRLTKFLDTAPDNITTYVLASYNCPNERQKIVWFTNYNKMIRESNSHALEDLAHIHKTYDQRDWPEEQTDPAILNYRNKKKYQIAMNRIWELNYYLSLHPEIKNIYVMGTVWEICIRNRPLGYQGLFEEISNVNILVNPDYILKLDATTPDITNEPDWKHIENNIYKYEPINPMSVLETRNFPVIY